MWLSNIENVEIVKAIYKNKEPNLDNATIEEVIITTGEDVIIKIKLDIDDLPIDIPAKWKIKKINSVQFIMTFIGVTITTININKDNYSKSILIIKLKDEFRKQILCKDNKGNVFFEIEAKWIYINNIIGHIDEDK